MKRMKLNIQLFAGSLSISAYETEVSVTNNTSYVHLTITATTSSSTYNNSGNAYVNATLTGQNNTISIPKTYFTIGKGKTVTVYDANVGPFAHNADGTLNAVSISASSYITSSTQPTASATCSMSTIPRTTSCPSVSAPIGTTKTITISPASSSFTHEIYYKLNNVWQIIGAYGAGVTSINWSIPRSLAQYADASGNLSLPLQLNTYSGSTLIGTSGNTLSLTSNSTIATPCPSLSGNVGDSVYIGITPASSAYTHKLVYTYNGTEYTIAQGNINGTYWTVPASIANYMPTSTTINLPLKLYTYLPNGNTLGMTTGGYAYISLNPATLKPSITALGTLTDTNETTVTLSGSSSKVIAFYSRPSTTITYSLSQGASLANVKIYYKYTDTTDNTVKYKLVGTSTTDTVVFEPPTMDMANTALGSVFEAVVTDSRGQVSDMYEFDIGENFIPYTPINVVRIDVDRLSTLSDKMVLGVALEYWKGAFNSSTPTVLNAPVIQYRVKENSGNFSNWVTFTDYVEVNTTGNRYLASTGTVSGSAIDYDVVEIDNPLSQDGAWNYLSRYTFEFEIHDSLDTRSNPQKIIYSAYPIYDAWQTEDGSRYFNINGNLLINNEPVKPNCAVFSKSNSQNFTDANFSTIKFNGTDLSSDYFSLSNDGTIKVLKDISTVLVTVNLRLSNLASGAGGNVYVQVNGISGTGFIASANNPNNVINCSGVLSVRKGDNIVVSGYFWSGTGSANTNGVDGYNRDWAGISVVALK